LDTSSGALPGCALGCQPLTAIIELVVMDVCDEAEPDVIVRMVEDQTFVLAVWAASQ
jgi:hypothetical protein